MRSVLILTTLALLIALSLAARSTATSFCKCICFNNSTIIALNPSSTTSVPQASPDSRDSKHHLTCSSCNRAFCLSYNLPICKDATENDVFTTCFQRDSLKDETVVILFLFATAGLLGWALIRPLVERLKERRYLPLGAGQAGGGRAGRTNG